MNTHMKRNLTLGLFCTALLATPAFAQQGNATMGSESEANKNPNPYMKADDSFISLSGTVENLAPDSFLLDYGDGLVKVEMDDFDTDADAYGLANGDKVTVNGRIDDDFIETTTIEAGSVYVQDLNTVFYANPTDEEDLYYRSYWTVSTPVVLSQLNVIGTVSEINHPDEFVINTGERRLEVETESMPYNPLDDVGFQQVDVGDVVSVTGSIDEEFFDGRVLEADTIVTLASTASNLEY